MLYRQNPKSGDMISQLSFGCMRLPRKGVGIDIPRSADMIHSAIEKGVNYFDMAYIYPGSETAMGQILENGWREKVNIATKMPLILVRSGKDFNKYFGQQLERLKTKYIDYYLLHMLTDINQYKRLQEYGIEKWVENEKKRRRIKNFGFSFHGRKDSFIELIDAYDWDFCMIQYNYLDENYQAGTEGLKYAHSKGIPVIVMEPLRGGKLANGLPKSALEEFHKANPDRSPAEWGFRWLWDHPEVTSVLSGMNDENQIEENIKIASEAKAGDFTNKDLAAIEIAVNIIRENIKVDCTGCGYCMPCPAGVDIPNCFSRYNDSCIVSKTNIRFNYMVTAGVVPDKKSYASLCKKCGKCEKHCPQEIKIMDTLEQAAKFLEPIWVKPLADIMRSFTR